MAQYNNDELTWPDWLDSSFFNKVLRTYKHDQTVEVKSFELAPGTTMGEHFASIMFKATVVFSSKKFQIDDKEIHLIMKLLPTGDSFKANSLNKLSYIFNNEIRMYTSILPEMERILDQAGERITFAPTLVYQSLNDYPSPIIVLVDVRPEGYVVPPWGVENFDTVKVVAKTIARFHAASLYLLEEGADYDFGEHFLIAETPDGKPKIDQFVKPTIIKVIKDLGKTPGYEEISQKLLKNIGNYLDIVKNSYYPNSVCGYKVLNHADFHPKNLLIRNGGRVEEDVYLIDYQFPCFSTPAIDVYYLINMMTNPEIRAKHREEILRFYFSEFSETLKKIGFRGKVPTLLDFRIELLRWSAIDLIQSLGMVGVQFVDTSKFDFNKLATDPKAAIIELQRFITESQAFKSHVQESVLRLRNKGVLG